MGYGEGGLLALYAAVLDRRIDRTVVSGYFQPREELWKEPIYRNVWDCFEFGDAELARLIGPNNGLIVEACAGPRVNGPPAETSERTTATPNGKLETPSLESVRSEIERSHSFDIEQYGQGLFHFVINEGGHALPGSDKTLRLLLSDTTLQKR